jgi:hypothetical protein
MGGLGGGVGWCDLNEKCASEFRTCALIDLVYKRRFTADRTVAFIQTGRHACAVPYPDALTR